MKTRSDESDTTGMVSWRNSNFGSNGKKMINQATAWSCAAPKSKVIPRMFWKNSKKSLETSRTKETGQDLARMMCECWTSQATTIWLRISISPWVKSVMPCRLLHQTRFWAKIYRSKTTGMISILLLDPQLANDRPNDRVSLMKGYYRWQFLFQPAG